MRTLVASDGERPPLSRMALAWLAVGCLVLALTLGTNVVRPLLRGLQVSAEIVRRTHEYRQQVRDNADLRAELEFLQTEAGQRWVAWRHLGLVEPGWQVGRTLEEPGPAGLKLTRPERLQHWLSLQQEARAKELRNLGAVLLTYGSGRAPYQPPTARNSEPGKVSKQATGTPPAAQATNP